MVVSAWALPLGPIVGGVFPGSVLAPGALVPPAGLLPPAPVQAAHVLDAQARVVEPAREAQAAADARRASRRPHHLEPEQIREAFRRAQGNATQAAESLGCHKTTLYRAMQRFGMTPESLRDEEQRRAEPAVERDRDA